MAPVAVSVAHFLLQMVLLRVVDKAVFGLLALVLGFIQFGFGLSNALVSTPYTLDVNHQPADHPSKLVYFKVNALFSIFWGACCAALAVGFGHAVEAWMFGAFGLLAMVRWFGRAHLYALHRPTRAAIFRLHLCGGAADGHWSGLVHDPLLEYGFAAAGSGQFFSVRSRWDGTS